MSGIPFEETLAYYHYDLPEILIAQSPAPRGTERLLVLRKDGMVCDHRRFSELPELLPNGALLVANNSKVMPVRISGVRSTGGKTECLLLHPVPLMEEAADSAAGRWAVETDVLLRPAKVMRIGETVCFPDEADSDRLMVTVVEKGAFGRHRVRLAWCGGRGGLALFLRKHGRMPLPPYIRREVTREDVEAYQTVYARADKAGSAAAPTAGLHFTEGMRADLLARGFGWAEVTLHVGYGTFAPVRECDVRKHVMHAEYVECPEETANAVRAAKREGRPVIAVGTTACRTLEGVTETCGELVPFKGWTDIFIRPGYGWHVTDGLITNFHLPESTLLMLVSALAGHDPVMHAYAEAVRCGYRFFSYGDAMLIL